MNEEPFGPIAAIQRFSDDEEAFAEANRLPYGLAAYAYTRSAETATRLATQVESGMMSINHHGIALPRRPSAASRIRATAARAARRRSRPTSTPSSSPRRASERGRGPARGPRS